MSYPDKVDSATSVNDLYNAAGLDCAVCFELQKDSHILTKCFHTFCKGCLDQLRNKRCPLCEKEFTAVEMKKYKNNEDQAGIINALWLRLQEAKVAQANPVVPNPAAPPPSPVLLPPPRVEPEGEKDYVVRSLSEEYRDLRTFIPQVNEEMGWSDSMTRRVLDRFYYNPENFMTIEVGGDLVGYLILSEDRSNIFESQGYISYVGIKEPYYSQGYPEKLIRSAVEQVRSRGWRRAYLYEKDLHGALMPKLRSVAADMHIPFSIQQFGTKYKVTFDPWLWTQ